MTMTPKPIPSPIQDLIRAKNKDEVILKIASDLIKLHGKFIEKVDRLENEISKQRGPQGIRGPAGPAGKNGSDGISPDVALIVAEVIAKVKKGIDGENGKTPVKGVDYYTQDEIGAIVKYIQASVKDGLPGKDAQLDIPHILSALIDHIKKNKVLDMKHLGDYENFLTEIRSRISQGIDGTSGSKQKKGGGGGDTVAAGNGITLSEDKNGNVVISASGGGFTTLLATETPDGSRTVFTFPSATAKPTFIISDNAQQRSVTSSGTVNWTWDNAAHQATMTIPPQDDIIGIK